MRHTTLRKALSSLFVGFCALSVLVALVPLALVLFYVVSQGITSVNLNFFTRMPRPVGEPGGGMANAIVGTLILTGLGSLMALQLLVTTNWLVVRGTARYSSNAALLSQYLPGYTVSFLGSIIGAIELFAVAFVVSHVLAGIYNAVARMRMQRMTRAGHP